MKLKIAICDDEKIIREKIAKEITSLPGQYDIYLYSSGEDLLKEIMQFQVIFLDMQMQGIDGLKTATKLREKDTEVYIIFLTSYMEYMQSAFKVKAFRYLSKPVKKKELEETIGEIQEEIQEELLNIQSVVIVENGVEFIVKVKDIICFEAFGDGTYIYTKEKVYETNNSLKNWIKILDSHVFIQVHRSFVISLRHYLAMESDEVKLDGMKETVPVSRRNRKSLTLAIQNYVIKQARYI